MVAGSLTAGVVITDCHKASKKISMSVAMPKDSSREIVLVEKI